MKINYIVLLKTLNKVLLTEGCDILQEYVDLHLMDNTAKTIINQLEQDTGITFSSEADIDNPEIIQTICGYYCSDQFKQKFHNKISSCTILKMYDVDKDGKVEQVLLTSEDIVKTSNEHYRTRMTVYICGGVLFACFSYLFLVTFGNSFIDPDKNARFVDQILSNINSVINMVVMFFINIFFLGSNYGKSIFGKNKGDSTDRDDL